MGLEEETVDKGKVEVEEYWGFHRKIHVQGFATMHH